MSASCRAANVKKHVLLILALAFLCFHIMIRTFMMQMEGGCQPIDLQEVLASAWMVQWHLAMLCHVTMTRYLSRQIIWPFGIFSTANMTPAV